MEEKHLIDLKVVLNHKEDRELNSQKYRVYTFTDFISGNSFDSWSIKHVDFVEDMGLLIDSRIIRFNLVVKKTGQIKLYPIELVGGKKWCLKI